MPRWIPRAAQALLVSFVLPAAVAAQPPAASPPPPAATLPPAGVPTTPRADTNAVNPNGTSVPLAGAVSNGLVYIDPYHAATPYNPTVVNQNVPNPGFNRPFTTLPCANPNQNFDSYESRKPECGRNWFRKGGCGCESGCSGGNSALHKGGHACEGSCSKGGSCTTCCNTNNFVLGSSRSFFGESSREFFERPASTDGIKMKPVKYAPPPAPAAYVPAGVVVP